MAGLIVMVNCGGWVGRKRVESFLPPHPPDKCTSKKESMYSRKMRPAHHHPRLYSTPASLQLLGISRRCLFWWVVGGCGCGYGCRKAASSRCSRCCCMMFFWWCASVAYLQGGDQWWYCISTCLLYVSLHMPSMYLHDPSTPAASGVRFA